MIRLELAGMHTRLHSTLCGSCPQGPTGCCASPPGVEWSDLGRIVSLGGAGWLLEQMAAGNLRPGQRGLLILRVEPRGSDGGALPKRCAFHGHEGCTIPPERRAATCNYYVCDDAFAHGGEPRGAPEALAGRKAHDALVDLYGSWDLELADRIRERWPDGPPWNLDFLDWLGREVRRLAARAGSSMRLLRTGT
ncbi:hypothetical protein WMF45_02020 [Sorangium sp. So ce448]|uniref:hypothetical protein n=1 Tax=Sorangium sp. So ce448 TaxID=3133314 RepID=UPI003F62F317